MAQPMLSLRHFIDALRSANELVEIDEEVDSSLEIAEIHRRVSAVDGPALLFKKVNNSHFPVVTNLFGSIRRMEIAFQNKPEKTLQEMLYLLTREFPPSFSKLWKKRSLLSKCLRIGLKSHSKGPVTDCLLEPADLMQLPFLKSWPLDGGDFLTLPLVYTECVETGTPNLGMYRIQRYDRQTTGLHFQIAKGGGFHFHKAEEKNLPLPVTIFLGGPPALILGAIAPLPENISELLLASFLQGEKLSVVKTSRSPHALISECEFALTGEARPGERRLEGPFGDHYGYYSWAHDFPVFHCKKIFHRKDAIYPATVVGKPRQEDYYIGRYLQDLLSPLFPIVMPGVKALWSFGETGFHALSAAVVQERYYRECMSSAFRILGEGQLSLTKFLLLTDQMVDVKNFKAVLTTVLERFRPETDLFIFANLSLDTLDYSGPELNKGSRGVMVGVGEKIRDLPEEYQGELPRPLSKIAVFCPGCLVIQGPPFGQFQELQSLLEHPDFTHWPLIVLVDDCQKALKNEASFLWTTFTRFEPAADIYAAHSKIHRHHLCYQGPLLIDARMKPQYPPEVSCDPDTAALVSKRWKNYFPSGMAMGDSDVGHVC